jgi:hypothetical protein
MKVSSLKCKDQTYFKSTLSDDINMRCIVLIYKSTLSDDEESQKGSTKKMLFGKPVAGACMAFTIYIKFLSSVSNNGLLMFNKTDNIIS